MVGVEHKSEDLDSVSGNERFTCAKLYEYDIYQSHLQKVPGLGVVVVVVVVVVVAAFFLHSFFVCCFWPWYPKSDLMPKSNFKPFRGGFLAKI